MKPSEAAMAVGSLMAAYPNARMPDSTIEVYETMLSDLDYELARAAIKQLVCTSKFLPSIAEIREAAAQLSLGTTRSAVEAWGDVTKAIRRVGSYGMPKFKDPIVTECVKAMGWRHLCLGDASEAADRKNFCDMYNDLQRKQRTRDVSEPGRLLPAGAHDDRALPGNVVDLIRKVAR